MTDAAMGSLVGLWFHAWRRAEPEDHDAGTAIIVDGRVATAQGEVVDQVAPLIYLVRYYDFTSGMPQLGMRLVHVRDMDRWTFYASPVAMRVAAGCAGVDARNRRCGRTVDFIAAPGVALCAACAPTHTTRLYPVIVDASGGVTVGDQVRRVGDDDLVMDE